MTLLYGEPIADISDDEDALREFLENARGRERRAPEESPEFEGFEGGALESDPDPEYRERSPLEDRLMPDSLFEPPQGRAPSQRVRKDIQAKTALMLLGVAKIWQGRDGHCGAAAVEVVPDVSEKLADIFCDSPDIVRWFTASGKYMKWLDLVMALQPLGEAWFAHHVTHSAGHGAAPVDWNAYSAGG